MIITRKKEFDKILHLINNKSVFIIGCSECATLCKTGGIEEVNDLKGKLEEKNIKVTGSVILDPACHLLNDKRLLREHSKETEEAEKIIVLACGNGVQTVAEIFEETEVISGTDTLFLGEIKRLGFFEKRCNMCGECIQDIFYGFCPVSRCPKSMLNGPCGGVVDGKCEIDKEQDCVWSLIIKRLEKNGELDRLKKICEPKDWSKSIVKEWDVQNDA